MPPTTSPLLKLQGDVVVPDGDDGRLSVVTIGAPNNDTGTVPVLIRNRTSEPLSGLEVTGTARGSDRALIASGASQGFAPAMIGPGEWAFGYVFFDGPNLAADTEFDLTATGQQPDDFSSVDVQVAEVNRSRGDFGDQLVGIVENPSATDEVGGPISIMVACFDERGKITSTVSGFAEADSLPPGGTSSFSVDLFDDPCPSWALGGSGYTF